MYAANGLLLPFDIIGCLVQRVLAYQTSVESILSFIVI